MPTEYFNFCFLSQFSADNPRLAEALFVCWRKVEVFSDQVNIPHRNYLVQMHGHECAIAFGSPVTLLAAVCATVTYTLFHIYGL